jgi:DNA invertase Pin-like site-specific DNA recombinase
MKTSIERPLRVGIYRRVSTADKDQDPKTQLMPLREFVSAQGCKIYQEYIDIAPATNLHHRVQWRQLLEDASKRKLDLLLVWTCCWYGG